MEKLTEKFKTILVVTLSLLFSLSCSKNFYDELADKEEDDAVYFEAQKALDDLNYSQAILLIQSLGADYQTRRDVNFTLASAFAGRCGLNFISLAETLSDASATGLFGIIMQGFPGSSDNSIADCISAESVINTVESDPTLRTVDENLLMAFVAFSKIGVILNRYADSDDDGSPDGGFDHCSNADFPEADVRQIGTGIGNAVLSLGSAGSTVGGSSLTALTDLCAADPLLNSLCTITDPAVFDANGVKAIRAAATANEFIGIGACNNTVVNCFLACP